MEKIVQYWLTEKDNEKCYYCKSKEIYSKVLMKNEYGILFIAYLCRKCFLNTIEKPKNNFKKEILEHILKRLEKAKRNKNKYNVIDLLPYSNENLALMLTSAINYLKELGFEVKEGKGRSRGHYQVIVEKEKHLELIKSLINNM